MGLHSVTLMIALVSLGQVATIEPGPGATCFGLVVVLTLIAAESFDPRSIWDEMEKQFESKKKSKMEQFEQDERRLQVIEARARY